MNCPLQRGRIAVAMALALVFHAGCATPAAVQSGPVATARVTLTVLNQTDYRWRLTVRPTAGGKFAETMVEPRATQTLELAAGDYLIEQQEVTEAGAPAGLRRELPATFVAGETYRWPIGTLLSDPDVAGAPVSSR